MDGDLHWVGSRRRGKLNFQFRSGLSARHLEAICKFRRRHLSLPNKVYALKDALQSGVCDFERDNALDATGFDQFWEMGVPKSNPRVRLATPRTCVRGESFTTLEYRRSLARRLGEERWGSRCARYPHQGIGTRHPPALQPSAVSANGPYTTTEKWAYRS